MVKYGYIERVFTMPAIHQFYGIREIQIFARLLKFSEFVEKLVIFFLCQKKKFKYYTRFENFVKSMLNLQ